MKRAQPWWLQVPIFIDWIGLSILLVLFVSRVVFHPTGLESGRHVLLILAVAAIMSLDAFGGFGHRWALLPRAALSFPAIFWCASGISWFRFEIGDGLLLALGVQQVWVLIACIVEDLRLRLHPKSRGT